MMRPIQGRADKQSRQTEQKTGAGTGQEQGRNRDTGRAHRMCGHARASWPRFFFLFLFCALFSLSLASLASLSLTRSPFASFCPPFVPTRRCPVPALIAQFCPSCLFHPLPQFIFLSFPSHRPLSNRVPNPVFFLHRAGLLASFIFRPPSLMSAALMLETLRRSNLEHYYPRYATQSSTLAPHSSLIQVLSLPQPDSGAWCLSDCFHATRPVCVESATFFCHTSCRGTVVFTRQTMKALRC